MVAELVRLRIQYLDVGNKEWEWAQLARRQLDHQPAELHETLLLLLESDGYMPFGDSEETKLLRETVGKVGPEGWLKTMDRIAASPRMQTTFHGWLASAVDFTVAEAWVGTDLQRARLLAEVTTLSGDKVDPDKVDPVARFLLTSFGNDDEVASSLRMNYILDTSSGDYSANYQAQINRLTGWIDVPDETHQVRTWARRTVAALTAQRDQALRVGTENDQ